jgi:hypothetical protein
MTFSNTWANAALASTRVTIEARGIMLDGLERLDGTEWDKMNRLDWMEQDGQGTLMK